MKHIDIAYRNRIQKQGHGHICYVLVRSKNFVATALSQLVTNWMKKINKFKSNLPFKGWA